MQIICVGYPKTGTKSIVNALRLLGYSVHDVGQHYGINLDNYLMLIEGREEEGTVYDMYKDVDAIAEVPANMVWYKIFQAFPSVKVVLHCRSDEERHGKSVQTTVDAYESMFGFYANHIQPWLSVTRAKLMRLERSFINIVNPQRFTASDIPKSYVYQCRLHEAAVKQLVPTDQLLVFNSTDGWEPLCMFLGREVPDVPYPKKNVTKKNQIPDVVEETLRSNVFDVIETESRRSLLKLLGLTIAVTAGVVYACKKDVVLNRFM